MRVATYSRVSTSHHGQNPEVQVAELRRYVQARGWEVSKEIIDHGFSGSTDKRPGLKQLMDLARSREIDCIVVVKLDRLFRSLKHLVTTLEELESLGVQFVAVKDSVDWTTPAGRFFVQVLGSLAELEKGILRERTMLGLLHARNKGIRLGRPKIHDGSMIRALRLQGKSYREISKFLSVPMGTITKAIRNPD